MTYKIDLENITIYKNDATNFGAELLRLVMKADLAGRGSPRYGAIPQPLPRRWGRSGAIAPGWWRMTSREYLFTPDKDMIYTR